MPRQKPKRSPHSDAGGARRDKESSVTSSLRINWLGDESSASSEEEGEVQGGAGGGGDALPPTPTPAHTSLVERSNRITRDKLPRDLNVTATAAVSTSAVDDKDDVSDWVEYARRQRAERGFGLPTVHSAPRGEERPLRSGAQPQQEDSEVKNDVPVADVDADADTIADAGLTAKQEAIQEDNQPNENEVSTAAEAKTVDSSVEDAINPTENTLERPVRVQRMASLASSVLTMDNEDEEQDVDMDIDHSSNGQMDNKEPVEQVIDPVLPPPVDNKETVVDDTNIAVPVPAARKPSTSSSNAIAPNMDFVKKTRRSSKLEAKSQDDEKPVVAQQPAVLEEDEPEPEGAGGGDITRCVCGRGGKSVGRTVAGRLLRPLGLHTRVHERIPS